MLHIHRQAPDQDWKDNRARGLSRLRETLRKQLGWAGSPLWSAMEAGAFAAGPAFHRVNSIAKYIGALREQEKRIKCLESQASQQPTAHYSS